MLLHDTIHSISDISDGDSAPILTDFAANHEGSSALMRLKADAKTEERVLTTDLGRELLARVGSIARAEPAHIARWRKEHTAEEVAAALRLVETRRRGGAKFTRAAAMWFEGVGLEQSTSELVARHKAARFQDEVVIDLCCGIGGDALAIAERAAGVVAVDLEEAMTRRVRWNAEVYGVGHKVAPVRARAEQIGIDARSFVHIDPDRRAGKFSRARAVADYAPGLPFLRELIRKARGGAIKLSASSDFVRTFGDLPVEIELISLAGECKEATIWFGELAQGGPRATAISGQNVASWTVCDSPVGDRLLHVVKGPLAWVFDPDPSLARAGLLDGFAVAHGLARIASGCDFLTGPARVDSPFLTSFEVEETMPLDLKRLKRLVSDRKLGPLEIKTKGLALRPEELRQQLRPDGPNPATLLLMGGRGPSLAIIARRGV